MDEADWKMDLKMTKQVFRKPRRNKYFKFRSFCGTTKNLYIGAVVYDNDYKCEAKRSVFKRLR
ncbi:MAG: hypothetical protein L6V93_06025 [Clostridiales bacterium]|nr:MAG: hypothetical protein L6V93_06025 [Clostridiales bacterium]